MQVDPFYRVRQDAEFVVAHARHVHLNFDKLTSLAGSLQRDHAQAPFWDNEQHFVGPKEEMAAFVVQFSAINFGLSSHSPIRPLAGLDAYRTAAQRLTERFAAKGPLTNEELLGATPEFSASLLGQRLEDEGVHDLMQAYSQSFRQLGTFLRDEHNGSLKTFLDHASNSADRLLSGLLTMPMYQDAADYKGRRIAFFARAQMCVSDLNLALDNKTPALFDIRKLTAFANETVPHLLHVQGVLVYDDALHSRIARGEPLSAGGEEEVEIRAATIRAIDLLTKLTSSAQSLLTARDIDFLLWRQAEDASVTAIPSHWSHTTAY